MKKIDKLERKRLNLIKKEIKKELLQKFGPRCYYCEETFFEDGLTLDHVIPVKTLVPKVRNRFERKMSRLRSYETEDISNFLLACGPCNVRKGDSNVTGEVFRRKTLKKEKGTVCVSQGR